MDLNRITFFAFQKNMAAVMKELNSPGGFGAVLDQARCDLPITEGLLSALIMLMKGPEIPGKEMAVTRAERDLTVFLALRRMQSERSGDNCVAEAADSGPRSLRLRRYGLN